MYPIENDGIHRWSGVAKDTRGPPSLKREERLRQSMALLDHDACAARAGNEHPSESVRILVEDGRDNQTVRGRTDVTVQAT